MNKNLKKVSIYDKFLVKALELDLSFNYLYLGVRYCPKDVCAREKDKLCTSFIRPTPV